MTPTEKFNNEKSELKENRINRILSSAFELFAVKGIDTIVMTDIAKKAEIGVASLYRYFETKEEIAIRTAIWAWNTQKEYILPEIQNPAFEKLSGIEQLKIILGLFTKLYENQQDFLRFIYFFDSYAVRQQIETKRLQDYELMIATVQNVVKQAIVKGLEDKSINPNFMGCEDNLYFTLMHAMFNTAQKMSLANGLLEMDQKVSGSSQLNLLTDLLIESLKNY